ncbi:hypothetical protein [Ramlibacter humi]|uniref:Uncharacterized protein n=1 Tax=Ramlibacter humi TaxID=2530451 RepID=A0A4Z0BLM3_9BURK|nr:hypothetical protein [Ramlibacter humi]TFY99004.1 hypothetical protein EZ216_15690 [Ramlibacter humi]
MKPDEQDPPKDDFASSQAGSFGFCEQNTSFGTVLVVVAVVVVPLAVVEVVRVVVVEPPDVDELSVVVVVVVVVVGPDGVTVVVVPVVVDDFVVVTGVSSERGLQTETPLISPGDCPGGQGDGAALAAAD